LHRPYKIHKVPRNGKVFCPKRGNLSTPTQ
jgi:hypothetical protein